MMTPIPFLRRILTVTAIALFAALPSFADGYAENRGQTHAARQDRRMPSDAAMHRGDAAKPALQNIALLLVQNGLAVIRPCNRPLPEMDTTAGDFQNQLNAAEAEARSQLCGGWATKE